MKAIKRSSTSRTIIEVPMNIQVFLDFDKPCGWASFKYAKINT